MENSVVEGDYSISFRKDDALVLGRDLDNRRCIVLIGMKRVGISNFLRFFLNNKDVVRTYIGGKTSHVFIPVDLNDLVEKEISPFWILTLKRISDAVEKIPLKIEAKKKIESLFLDSIQSQDLFLTIDCVRKVLVELVENGYLPTLFFIRFDRMGDAVTPEFFSNLQGLRDATMHKLSYVFTSYRGLDAISPSVFKRASLSVFSKNLYIKPAKEQDTKTILNTYKDRYRLNLSSETEKDLFDIVDGYIQYLQLALIHLHERQTALKGKDELFQALLKDERIALQSEELWESLDDSEKNVLLKVEKSIEPTKEEREKAKYLWDTGLLAEISGKSHIFSPLFSNYIKQRQTTKMNGNGIVELSKKENLLFGFLKSKKGEICEREEIVQAVWAEVEDLGVSDWAIDRLVARLRTKLKVQKSNFEIQTIKTRGYKLIEN